VIFFFGLVKVEILELTKAFMIDDLDVGAVTYLFRCMVPPSKTMTDLSAGFLEELNAPVVMPRT